MALVNLFYPYLNHCIFLWSLYAKPIHDVEVQGRFWENWSNARMYMLGRKKKRRERYAISGLVHPALLNKSDFG